MVDKNIVEYVSNLARIELSEEEKKLLAPQLSMILDYIDKLQTVDVKDVNPTRAPVDQQNLLREDCVIKNDAREDIIKNAPLSEDGFFRIPKVIE